MNKGRLLLSIALSVLFSSGFFILHKEIESKIVNDEARVLSFKEALRKHEETIGVVEELSKNAKAPSDLNVIREKAKTLPKEAKDYFVLFANVKELEFLSEERDRLLWSAGELYKRNQRDPGIAENTKRAKEIQTKIKELLQGIGNSDNSLWNMTLEYRRGYEMYRSLAFVEPSNKGEALEILESAVSHIKDANLSAPKNNRLELALEFLYRKNEEESAKGQGGAEEAPGPPRAIPPRRPRPFDDGQGLNKDGPGTGGADRQRRH